MLEDDQDGGAGGLTAGQYELVSSLIDLVSNEGVRVVLEFDDQEISAGDETIVLNGSTVVKGQ